MKTSLTNSKEQNAQADAEFLIENSAIIRSLVSCDVIVRTLFLSVRQHLEQNIRQGWEVSNPDLVFQTLRLAAQDRAVQAELNPEELRNEVIETLVPVLDIFAQLYLAENCPRPAKNLQS